MIDLERFADQLVDSIVFDQGTLQLLTRRYDNDRDEYVRESVTFYGVTNITESNQAIAVIEMIYPKAEILEIEGTNHKGWILLRWTVPERGRDLASSYRFTYDSVEAAIG